MYIRRLYLYIYTQKWSFSVIFWTGVKEEPKRFVNRWGWDFQNLGQKMGDWKGGKAPLW